jgi:hypothetical protein
MPLTTRLTLTPLSGGSSVSLHGCSGQIHYVATVGERFRRPGAGQAGYQTLGRDCKESTLSVWHALSTQAEGDALIKSLQLLVFKVVSVTYKEYSAVKCIITDVNIDKLVATRGSIITGSTPAAFRLEATIKLEQTP